MVTFWNVYVLLLVITLQNIWFGSDSSIGDEEFFNEESETGQISQLAKSHSESTEKIGRSSLSLIEEGVKATTDNVSQSESNSDLRVSDSC